MSHTVLLHVGTPKTGTSYLQDVLFRNQKSLRVNDDILYPADRHDAHFLAALDLMKMPWGGLEREAVGAWDRLAERVRAHEGISIISHEILATASRSQAGRALESLVAGDTEIHLVLSVRDLIRQIPAEWQENVKHRAALSYEHFLQLLQDPDRDSRIGSWFWGVQEIPDILDRWGSTLPPERVHLVTVPRPGGAPDELWRRFSRAFGLDGLAIDMGVERANPSLGVPETALVRRINLAANKDVPPAHYRPLVRELLAHQTLSQRTGSARLSLPPDLVPWVVGLQEAWITEIAGRGYDVIGDLDDLRGVTPDPDKWVDPDQPREKQVAAAAVDALRAVLVEAAASHEEVDRLRGEVDHLRDELDRARLRPSYRFREKVVRRLQRSRAGRGALGLYRTVRGRNSRSA